MIAWKQHVTLNWKVVRDDACSHIIYGVIEFDKLQWIFNRINCSTIQIVSTKLINKTCQWFDFEGRTHQMFNIYTKFPKKFTI